MGNSPILLNNLPVPLSTFIGRNREIAEVKQLLSEHRLLALTGPGGSGKTRLALRVASELLANYPDGIWLTEFAALADGDLVPQAVASTLGVREQAGHPFVESLTSYLQPRTTLLVLDNCEHLVDACAQLSAALLVSCPNIRLLATSREPLGVPGEAVWLIPPLSLPDPQPWRSPGMEQETVNTYQQSEAIQLFVARAAAAFPDFSLTVENGPWVAEICRRLDGIPLAIELAAARLRAFSARQIAERLDDRFHLLTSQLRAGPLRHHTLEAALDWSYALLSNDEQIVLQRLSVFATGWTLEAVEAVCSDEVIRPAEVLDLLSNLVDKSFVLAEISHDRRRYRLLETIRQYAHQKSVETREAGMVRDRHLDYFVRWAEMASTHLTGPDQSQWLERFEAEHDNIRAAFEWSHTTEDRAELGLRLAAACGYFWRLHAYLSEGRERLVSSLERAGVQDRNPTRAWALIWAANLAYLQSDYPATRSLVEEALSICRDLGPAGKSGVARALDIIGELATEIGDYESAPVLFEEALGIYQELEEKRGIADMLMQLGWASMRAGDYERADALLNECLPLFRELDETALIGLSLSGLGELAIRKRQFERANELLEESLALRRELGERWGIAASLGTQGWVALVQRDFSRMGELMGESLVIRMEIGDQGGVAWCLEKLAEAKTSQAHSLPSPHRHQALRHAVCIWGAAAALRAPLNSVIDPADQPEYERIQGWLRGALGKTAFDAAWEEGTTMPIQDIVELALAPMPALTEAASLSSAQLAKVKFGGLSPREREAAVLIAQGKANREIAEAMVVSVKTVETYITRILNKLGFDSRVQIATWALEVGLTELDSGDS